MSEPLSLPAAPFASRARFVWIEWDDAASLTLNGWTNWGELTPEAEPVVTVGFLVAEDALSVVIASTVCAEGHNGHFRIPRSCVVRMADIPLPT